MSLPKLTIILIHQWLMGDRPVDPFRVRHRQYEEMSEKSVMSDDGRVNVEKRENGENDEGENDKNGENDEGDHKGTRSSLGRLAHPTPIPTPTATRFETSD